MFSPTQRVGADADHGLRQGRATRVPMLSLDNAFSDEDLQGFFDRLRARA